MKKLLPFLFIVFTLSLQAQLTDVLTGLSAPLTIVLEGDYLYFEESGANTISRFNYTDATPVAEELASGLDFPTAVIPAGDKIYYGQNQTGNGKIGVADSGVIPLIFTDLVTNIEVNNLFLAGTDLYVSSYGAGKISKIDLTATTPMAVEVVTVNGPDDCLLIGDELFIALFSDGKVSKININDANPTPVDVVTGLSGPIDLVDIGDDLYIAEFTGNKISKINLNDANPTLVDVVTDLSGPTGMAFVDSGAEFYDIYIVENGAGKISKFVSTITDTEDLYTVKSVSITPNPASDYIQLNGVEGTMQGEIFDFQGRKIKSVTIENNREINVSDLPAGPYFVKLNGYESVRFMKQ